jgi:hypothetical protein
MLLKVMTWLLLHKFLLQQGWTEHTNRELLTLGLSIVFAVCRPLAVCQQLQGTPVPAQHCCCQHAHHTTPAHAAKSSASSHSGSLRLTRAQRHLAQQQQLMDHHQSRLALHLM